MDTKANAECQLNKSDNNITKAHHESGILYFRPETEEIIVVPAEDAGEFESHCLEMMKCVDEFHQANHAYSTAIEQYGLQRQKPGMNDTQSQAKEVVAAETALDKKREALLEKLKDDETSGMGYQDVVELLPLLDTRRKGPGNQKLGRRFAYASQRYYSERSGGRSKAGAKKKWRSVSLSNKDKATGKDSIYSVDSRGRRSIDTKKLKEQLTKDILPTIKVELKDYVNLDDYNVDKTLFDWAESWNKSLNGEHVFDNGVEVSGAAQFMRFVSNVGAEAEFNPNEGKVSIKGEAKASLALATGIGLAVLYIPDRLGWELKYKPGKKEDEGTPQELPALNMGVMRIYIENKLIGFAGASAQLEAQLQVQIKDDKQQVVTGQRQERLPRFQERQSARSGQFYQQMEKEDEGASLSAEAFAGARAEYSLKGAVQWLKPAEPAKAGTASVPKTVGEFSDLATIGTSIAGLAGIGAGAKFQCTFINGKFCFKVAASVCLGLGAKGAFLCEVGTKGLIELGKWLAYQLFALDYRFFDLVVKEAFETFTRICVMQIADLGKDIYQIYNEARLNMVTVLGEYSGFIENIIDNNKANMEASKRRNQLAKNIITTPTRLLNYTPEAKGILLYLLTRHGLWDHGDFENRGEYLLDIYPERKEAIIQILYSIQTKREWLKVMCHRTKDGSNLAVGKSEELVAKEQEQELREFLQEGFNRDDDMDRKAAQLLVTQIYQRLKSENEISWGYALAMNNTDWYNLNRAPNPHFPQRCEFGPCEATVTQLA